MSLSDPFVLETPRLRLRNLSLADADFILSLLNEPAFYRFIGDRGVRSIPDAEAYLAHGPLSSYVQHGYGLWMVEWKDTCEPLGICGLIKRDSLPHPDIGYAFLERFWSQGCASEAGLAVKEYAMHTLRFPRLLAVTDPENLASMRVLEKIGLKLDGRVRLMPDGQELNLFAMDRSSIQ